MGPNVNATFKASQYFFATHYGTPVHNRPDRDEPAIEIERMSRRQIEIPMRNSFSESRAGNLDRSDISAPWLTGIAVKTEPPDPFDGFWLTRVGGHEVANCEAADLLLTAWCAD